MMTRKDYVTTAQIISNYWWIGQEGDFEDLISNFSDMFIADNPRFSPNIFEKACYEKIDEMEFV